MIDLPNGYRVTQDDDGDWTLIGPKNVIIFSAPGEGYLLAAETEDDAFKEAAEHLSAIG